jgi:ATP-dependent helicase YprA (DUF1998 family)/very-short-patch-repair endonuclease
MFELRDRLVGDYASYIKSFLEIRDKRILEFLEQEFAQGALWPDPLIQLNPSFQPGAFVDSLVQEEVLHEECGRIFRRKGADDPLGSSFRLHMHQERALRKAREGRNYVLTTGTGSGKSLAYILPIVDHVVRRGTGKGIQAVIIYPMNALANSQRGELAKFLQLGYPVGKEPVRFARYTGQENSEERDEIIANPPDILLTNFMMLELLLTRPFERKLVEAMSGLRYIVLDELHTYRGRQGSDVALLVRRLRERADNKKLQFVGTSATMSTEGTQAEQRAKVAEVASELFGSPVAEADVITETLQRVASEMDLLGISFLGVLKERLLSSASTSRSFTRFVSDPLSIWIESVLGVKPDEEGNLVRTRPRRISGPDGAARELAESTEVPEDVCEHLIRDQLLAAYDAERNPETGAPAFAFRIHQFLSPGEAFYASIENPEQRHLTLQGQQFVPNDRERILLPMAFCRECGQDYYLVTRLSGLDGRSYVPRRLGETTDNDGEAGFLYISNDKPWPQSEADILERVPDDWLDADTTEARLRPNRKEDAPENVIIDPNGIEASEGTHATFSRAPFIFCLACGIAYAADQRSDIGKLSTLGLQGRSTATTTLSISAIQELRKNKDVEHSAKKLLSFTDNRQDASLQAGHLNDFVEVGLLRAALLKAVTAAGSLGLRHDTLTQKVFDALDLEFAEYAANPEARYGAREDADRTLRDVLAYRLYRDLRRGWRINAPNLEQTGLLKIDYAYLSEVCEDTEPWQGHHIALMTASPKLRCELCKDLLDYLRRGLALKVDVLNYRYQEQLRQRNSNYLKEPWALDEDELEKLERAPVAWPRAKKQNESTRDVFVSGRGGFGKLLRRKGIFPDFPGAIDTRTASEIIKNLFEALAFADLLHKVGDPEHEAEPHQVPASALIWKTAEGTMSYHDPIRVPSRPTDGGRTNPYFVDFYRNRAQTLKGISAREHTAQVKPEQREERERLFRKGVLPILYCSPTMELGVDIADLNIVNMRNMPPTPANYAQRSGRAGRSGQAALVLGYCTSGSPHDQYFFKRPEQMVSGAVAPPRLDLQNEDLVRSHIHAIWLGETHTFLGKSMSELLDVSGPNPKLQIREEKSESLDNPMAKIRARERAEDMLLSLGVQLTSAAWYHPTWLDEVIKQIPARLEASCERWRRLFRAATAQIESQHIIANDAALSPEKRQMAQRLRQEAENQRNLLLDADNVIQSDFYVYRYLASEGFLPGYNFPRLPLTAYVPARKISQRDQYLSRPRFLAINEFGPNAIVYHEGSRYVASRVVMPIQDQPTEDRRVGVRTILLCETCGYLHHGSGGADLCERCNGTVLRAVPNLFRLESVTLQRNDRITCDEEERMRQGYEITTAIRFNDRGTGPDRVVAEASNGDQVLARLTYAPAATLWRVNLGWNRRAEEDSLGFLLDVERGAWISEKKAVQLLKQEQVAGRVERVVPYVEDTRNALIFEPGEALDPSRLASLQAAVKSAIQIRYQLEDSELAAEPLPNRQIRNAILFYEAAEGGAGVLRQLVQDEKALRNVARTALDLCHFDKETLVDFKRGPRAKEDCTAACYDCLMSYGNQRDHRSLDRHLIKDFLASLRDATIAVSSSAIPRAQHAEALRKAAGSQLEIKWIEFLESSELRLPSSAQMRFESCGTVPDFVYADQCVAIYIDGPPHDNPERQKRDTEQQCAMEDLGFTVIRFKHYEVWAEIVAKYPNIFGGRP